MYTSSLQQNVLAELRVELANTRRVATLTRELQATDDEKLTHNFKLHRGEQVVFDYPKSTAIRLMGLNHSIHHRGQLTVYLRLLDVPVPGLYGPSADEK